MVLLNSTGHDLILEFGAHTNRNIILASITFRLLDTSIPSYALTRPRSQCAMARFSPTQSHNFQCFAQVLHRSSRLADCHDVCGDRPRRATVLPSHVVKISRFVTYEGDVANLVCHGRALGLHDEWCELT
eukprot:COSAG05_NODE_4573_length_1456_cov_1.546794_1_plen_130_part_00